MAKLKREVSTNIEDRRAGTVGGFLEMMENALYGRTLPNTLYDGSQPEVDYTEANDFPVPTEKTMELIDATIKQRYDMRMQQYIRATVPDRIEEGWDISPDGKLTPFRNEIWPNQDEPLAPEPMFLTQTARVADPVMQRIATQTYTVSKTVSRPAPTATELETLTYTLLGEAEGGGVMGMTAVANVIRNRADSGLYPYNPAEVATQAKQFSTWNSPAAGGNADAVKKRNPPGSKNYELAKTLAKNIIYAESRPPDITRGTLMYHKTGTTAYWQSEATTPWGTINIGGNTFYAREPAPQMVQATVAAVAYNGGAGVVDRSALSASTDRVVELTKGKTRDKPVDPKLKELLASVGDEADVYFEVTSGGQITGRDPKLKDVPGGWTGTHRHDLGQAADVKAYTLNADGSRHYLNMSNAEDRKVWERIVSLSVAGGATGLGADPSYMGNFTVHIGFGDVATWGTNGGSGPAPQWLADAYAAGGLLPPLNIPGVLTATSTTAGAPVPLLPPLKMLMANLPKLPFGATEAMSALAGGLDKLGGLNRMNQIIMDQRAAYARETMKFPEAILGDMNEAAMSVTPVLEWPDTMTDPRPGMDVVYDPNRGAFIPKATTAGEMVFGNDPVGLDALDWAMAAARDYKPVTIQPVQVGGASPTERDENAIQVLVPQTGGRSPTERDEAKPQVGGMSPTARDEAKPKVGGLSPTERAEQSAAMLTFPVRPEVPISDNTSNAPPFPQPRPASITTPPGPPAGNLPVGDLLTDQQKQALREIGSRTIVGGIVRKEVAKIASEALGAAAPQVLDTIAGLGTLVGSGTYAYPDVNYVRPEGPVPSNGAKRIDDIVSTFRGGGPIAVSASRPVSVIGKPAATTPTGKPITKEVRDAIANVPVTSYQTTTVASVPRGYSTTPTGGVVTTAQRNAISSLSGQTKTPVSKTVYVHRDGTSSTVRPADATIPRDYRPVITYETRTVTIPNPAANKPIVVPQPKPVGPATQTTDPAMRNAITDLKTSAPGAGLTAAQRNAMTSLAGTGIKNPVPPVPTVPIPATITKTIRVKKVTMVPVAPAPVTTKVTKQITVYNPKTGSIEKTSSGPSVIRGSSTNREYIVGQKYQTGVYIYQATPEGFKKLGTVGGGSSAEAYNAANSGPGSVAEMERRHSGGSANPQSGGPAAGGEYGGGGR